jgi:hypothetical protein
MENFKVEIDEFSDGSLSLTCGEGGMEVDLIFALGAMTGDPLLDKQRSILEYIAKKVNASAATDSAK